MLKIVTLCLIAMKITQQSCVKGCLKCVDNADKTAKVCSICDFLNKYVQDTNKTGCVLSETENCKIFGASGCLVCEENYLLDQGKCTAITTKLDNCAVYQSQTACLTCNNKSFVSSGKCTVITPLIDNCEVYSNATTCSKCAMGYELISNKCEAPKAIDNCIGYTNFECLQCSTEYIENKNLAVDQDSSDLFTVLRTNVNSWPNISAEKHILNLNRCQQIPNFNTFNCAKFETFDKCSVCNTGYFLTATKTCQKNPEDRIENCAKYTNLQTCSECISDHILSSVNTPNNKCTQLTADQKKQNCAQHSTTRNSSYCERCATGFYASNGSCQARSTEDNDNHMSKACQTFSETSDTCTKCKSGRSLAVGAKYCVSSLPNCIQYATDGTCTECVRETHYLSSGSCQEGSKQNFCATFQKTLNQCDTCQIQYYGTCGPNQKHNNIDNCKTYGNDEKWKCATCNDGYAVFEYENYCQNTYNEIPNCTTYNNSGACTACKDNFYLKTVNATTSCDPLSDNCKTGTYNANNQTVTCNTCQAGFYLDTHTKLCKTPFAYVAEYCMADQFNSTTNLTDAKCEVCGDKALSIDLANTHVCKSKDYGKSHYSDNAFVEIPNCSAYEQADMTKCFRCKDDKYIAFDQKTCVTSCNAANGDQYGYNAFAINAGVFQQYKHCLEQKADNKDKVLVQAPSLAEADNFGQISLKCGDKSFSVIPDAQNVTANAFTSTKESYSNVNPNNDGNANKFITHPTDVWGKVDCTVQTNASKANGVVLTTNVSQFDCLYWSKGGPDEFRCATCKWGQVPDGTQTDNFYVCKTTSQTTAMGFNNKRLFNITPVWSYYFSVHKCTADNAIPVLVLSHDYSKPLDLEKFAFRDDTWNTATTGFSDPLTCMNVSTGPSIKSAVGLASVDDAKFAAMPGCALAVINLDKGTTTNFDNTEWNLSTAANTDKQAMVCVACKNSYKPIPFTNKKWMGCEAQPISGCDTSVASLNQGEMFNGCFQCLSTHTHGWDDTNKEVDYTTCENATLPNCISLVVTNSVATCKMCASGYSLNNDNKCVKITTPKCADKFNAKLAFAANKFTGKSGKYVLYNNQKGTGCWSCDTNFFGFFVTTNARVCALNTTLNSAQTTTFPDNSTYINYCKHYNNTSAFKCNKCHDDADNSVNRKVLNDNGSKCVQTGMQNCKVSLSDNQCKECKQGPYFLNSSGNGNKNCVDGSANAVANCKLYDVTSQNLGKPVCTECKELYYLDSQENKCILGNIPKCKVYSTKTACKTCEDNFLLFSATNTAEYCITKPDNKCLTFSFQTGNKVKCETCQPYQTIANPGTNNFTVKNVGSNDLTLPLNQCVKYNTIANCKTYHVTTGITNPFGCSECEKNFWLVDDQNGYECRKRTTINNCSDFVNNKDECQTCSNGFFVDSTKKKCIAYPVGVLGCNIYKDASTCEKCDSGRYLTSANKCEVADNVDNCIEYSNKTTCKTCDQGYVLGTTTTNGTTKQVCEQGPNNCIVATSKTTCSQCASGYFLKNSVCSPNGISNCQIYTENSDGSNKKCEQCDDQRYFENGQCIENKGANCKVFTSKTVCKTCNSGFTLKTDGTCAGRDAAYDQNCSVSKVPTEFQCSLCAVGYKFGDNGCEKIDNFESGCLFAKLSDGSCNICSPNYYMDDNFKCISTSTGGGDGGSTSHLGIYKLFMIISILFVQFY